MTRVGEIGRNKRLFPTGVLIVLGSVAVDRRSQLAGSSAASVALSRKSCNSTCGKGEGAHILGVRYSTSLLAISANRLARRPPAKTTDGRREAAPRCFVDEGGVLLSDLR